MIYVGQAQINLRPTVQFKFSYYRLKKEPKNSNEDYWKVE